jgi:hypothetical protein
MMRKIAVHWQIVCFSLLGSSVCSAQATFSQATYITESQFLGQLKEVSLDLRSDPSLTKFISLAEQQNDIARTLSGYGIAVRSNSPVTLVARVTHTQDTVESRDRVTGRVEDTTVIHGIYISAQFFVKAAAWRNGKLHLMMASPALGWSGSTQAEGSGVRKFLVGDETQQEIKDRFIRIFGESLKAIASRSARDDAPWFVDTWTDKAKAAVDADYLKLMSSDVPFDKNPLKDLSSAPIIALDPEFTHESCKADPAWNVAWARVFERLAWTDKQEPRNLYLAHFFSCVYAYGLTAPRYFALSDRITLFERNLVFQLNGKLFRTWSEILTAHHEKLALEDTLDDRLEGFIPRHIQEFLTDLVLGNGSDDRPISTAPQRPVGSIPKLFAKGTKSTRLQLAEITAWNDGDDQRWFYENGTPIPDTYQLTGVAESPLFDLRFKGGNSPPDGFRDKINQLEAQVKSLLPAESKFLDEQLGWICNVYNGVYYCSHLYALDFERAEFVDSVGFPHLLIPCRKGVVRGARPYGDALCSIHAREWNAANGTANKIVFIGRDLDAALQTDALFAVASRENGIAILSALSQLAAEYQKYFELEPVTVH